MVIDTLEQLKAYANLNPLFGEVVAFLESHDLNTMECGKYPIKGDDLFLNLTVAKAKMPDEAVMETHRKMIDIQIPISTAETYGSADCPRVTTTTKRISPNMQTWQPTAM